MKYYIKLNYVTKYHNTQNSNNLNANANQRSLPHFKTCFE